MNKPEYIDIHCHMTFSDYGDEQDSIIREALDVHVWMINVGTTLETSREVVALAHRYEEGVYAIIGIHPSHATEIIDTDYENQLREMLSDDRVVGIGECGLDYFRLPGNGEDEEGDEESNKKEVARIKEIQKQVFRTHIELSLEYKKPLMIHCREAYDDVLGILKEYQDKTNGAVRANFHFFAGDQDDLKTIIDLGLHASFTGVITFARQYEALVQNTPLDRIMSETDAPYVTPVPYRGKTNKPVYVIEVVRTISDILDKPLEEIAPQIVDNALAFFNIDKR